METKYIFM